MSDNNIVLDPSWLFPKDMSFNCIFVFFKVYLINSKQASCSLLGAPSLIPFNIMSLIWAFLTCFFSKLIVFKKLGSFF